MSNHTARTTLPPPHLRWWQCDHEGPGIEGCPVCRKVPDKGAAMWAAGLLRALDRESLALVGSLAAERDRERRRAEAAEAERDAAIARADTTDVGGLEYEGNSVEHWWRKAGAYKKMVANLTAERDAAISRAEAAERDAETWRGFAGSVAIAVHGASTGGVIANHLAVDDLPDLLGAVERLRARAEAAEAALATARAEVDAAFQQGLTAGQVATCGALSAIASEVASAGFGETATAIRIAAATLIKADLRLERSPVEGA